MAETTHGAALDGAAAAARPVGDERPRVDVFYVTAFDGPLNAYDFSGRRLANPSPAVRPVALLQAGNAVAACHLDTADSQMLSFAQSDGDESLRVFDGRAFAPLPATIIPPEAT